MNETERECKTKAASVATKCSQELKGRHGERAVGTDVTSKDHHPVTTKREEAERVRVREENERKLQLVDGARVQQLITAFNGFSCFQLSVQVTTNVPVPLKEAK